LWHQKKYCQDGAELCFGRHRLSGRKAFRSAARLSGRLPIAAAGECRFFRCLQSEREADKTERSLEAEVAGDFYLIIIMMIIMIKIILHDGADDYNHMAMQGDLQLGMYEGGY